MYIYIFLYNYGIDPSRPPRLVLWQDLLLLVLNGTKCVLLALATLMRMTPNASPVVLMKARFFIGCLPRVPES